MPAEYTLPGACWPTEAQTWLLRAALLSGPPGVQAWETWRARHPDLAALDGGSRRLLPLLYDNLRSNRVSDPALAELKACFRVTWYQNQAIFHRMAGLLAALAAAGIPTLILKGAALAVLHYQNMGHRPMADFDILVSPADAPRTFALLSLNGWRCAVAGVDPARLLTVRHSVDFTSDDGSHFDLHWHALIDRLQPEADAAFWEAAVPAQINAIPTLALSPTHQLLHVCVHGAAYNAVPPLRWAADAMQVIRSAGQQVDWPGLVSEAGRLHLSEPLHDTLYYLQTRLDAPVPAAALAALKAQTSTPAERRLYQRRVSPPGPLGDLPLMWAHYACLAEADSKRAGLGGFIRFLQDSWGVTDLMKAPRFVFQKAVRRLKAARV